VDLTYLTGGNLEGLGWETDGALDAKFLGLGTVDEFLADFLKGVDLSAGQSDSDLVGFLQVNWVNIWPYYGVLGNRTGPSPNSFSGFWYDIFI